jgi:hypothetical protein
MDNLKALENLVRSTSCTKEEIASKVKRIYGVTLGRSRYIRCGSFAAISGDDLKLLFELYDSEFFGGLLDVLLTRNGRRRLFFRVSRKLTRSGGKTTRMRRRADSQSDTVYEIAISSTLLFQTFADVDRPVTVNGVLCRDRLEALQRVFEHELIHLVESVLWGESSCSAPRFRSMARQLFAHTEVTHQLVTQRERAEKNFGIRLGDRVTFRFDGQHYTGIVNRITKRATVLVESDRGRPYSDGKRYDKFYVPLALLEKSAASEPDANV